MSDPDTIRILISSDNHVGYNERDPKRRDDSWKTFHEVMCLAKEQDVDMVLLAGDLFHENKPSRKAMYQVMRSLRMNCLGDKPCELELLSDPSENFQGAFGRANYEDPDINVAIPVFSIHGNHDDPSGDGYLAALDILQMAGLINYYGRAPESDNISVRPVLLQKGRTKLALYGLSNVRDERLFRTFRDGKVKFFQPKTSKDEWFNILSVHQNHHAYTDTGYLPESFLPKFMDLVVWGHEHECLIDPRYNPEMGFHVMQPGSTVATSLVPGEAVPKRVAILSVTGKEFKTETIRLKSVRPFVMKEIVLADEKTLDGVWKRDDNRATVTRYLTKMVHELIKKAKEEYSAMKDSTDDGDQEIPAPLVRLRVEYSAPDGGNFDCENPQRISNRFLDEVANVNDVIQFHRKRATKARKMKDLLEAPDPEAIAQLSMDTVKVQELVQEFLIAQSLTILPQNSFGDAVTKFVDKDERHALETFVQKSLANQTGYLLENQGDDEDIDISQAMEEHRAKLEELFAQGAEQNVTTTNTDDALMEEAMNESPAPSRTSVDRPAPARAAAKPARAGRVRATKAQAKADKEEEEAVEVDSEEVEDDTQQLFVKPTRAAARATRQKAPAKAGKSGRAGSTPDVAQVEAVATSSTSSLRAGNRPSRARKPVPIELSDDEDDAFSAMPPTRASRSRR